MQLTEHNILQVFPKAVKHAANLSMAADRFEINTHLRQCHWLGQMAVESGEFSKFKESLNYQWDKLIPLFGSKRISAEQARRYGRIPDKQAADQVALANILYGGSWGARNLGNTQAGDGWRFIGRGPKQLTGRANYLSVSMGIYGDDRLIHHPELLEESEAGCLSAGFYWHVMRNINPVADKDDIFHVTKLVNGGTNGLEGTKGRRWWTDKCKHVLAGRPDFSGVTSRVIR